MKFKAFWCFWSNTLSISHDSAAMTMPMVISEWLLLCSLRANWGDQAQTSCICFHCLCPSSWESSLLGKFMPLLSPGSTLRSGAVTVCLVKSQCVSKVCPPKTSNDSKISHINFRISLSGHYYPKAFSQMGKNALSFNLQPNVSELLKKLDFLIPCPFYKKASFLLIHSLNKSVLKGSITSLAMF